MPIKDNRDFALALGTDGTVILHRADCPEVRQQAANGEPVLTLFDCENEPNDKTPRHSCLQSH